MRDWETKAASCDDDGNDNPGDQGGGCSTCAAGDFSPLPRYAAATCVTTSRAVDPMVPCRVEPYPTGPISGAGA